MVKGDYAYLGLSWTCQEEIVDIKLLLTPFLDQKVDFIDSLSMAVVSGLRCFVSWGFDEASDNRSTGNALARGAWVSTS
jgi:hypothetical protein